MNKKYRVVFFMLLVVAVIAAALVFLYFHRTSIAVLNPHGPISYKERQLILFASALSVLIVLPVFALTFGIAWRYRAGNKKAKYSPNLGGSRVAETVWWLIPSVLIIILSVVTWRSSHQLDPFKPLAGNQKPLTIEVVALDWKWLFIYPEQKIATVNYFQMPIGRPVNFVITSDAPMNSFWIPRLGGQIYAMSGMSTQLHLMADSVGDYRGSSANISGKGFSGMVFNAHAATPADFDAWVASAQHSPLKLTHTTYNQLAEPSENNPIATYSSPAPDLYATILNKYMGSQSMSDMGAH